MRKARLNGNILEIYEITTQPNIVWSKDWNHCYQQGEFDVETLIDEIDISEVLEQQRSIRTTKERGINMKAILISIQPQHVLNILNGSKTLELRKSVPKGYVGWVYVYVTKAKPYLEPRECNGEFIWNIHNDFIYHTDLNGKVVARFWFDEYEKIDFSNIKRLQEIKQQSRIDDIQFIFDYAKGKTIYAWHIKKLEVLEQPMGLDSFYTWKWETNGVHKEQFINTLSHAPQSWQYVWVKENV